MDGQMTIFEFLPQEADFCQMPESEVMEIIGQRIGVKFTWDAYLEEYSAKIGKIKLTAEISEYVITQDDSETVIKGHKFISVGMQLSGEDGFGWAAPRDSIDDAVDFFKRAIARARRAKNEADLPQRGCAV